MEHLDYDQNGNITRLVRTAGFNGTVPTKIDDLSYTYQNTGNSNMLQSIADASQNSSGYPYIASPTANVYDANGNMTAMMDKGINPINYNHLNLPNSITVPGRITTTTTYIYRADGTRVRKVYARTGSTIRQSSKIIDYIDGFQYLGSSASSTASALSGQGRSSIDDPTVGVGSGMLAGQMDTFVDSNVILPPPQLDNPDPIVELNPDLQFFPTAEGFYDYQKNQYIYQYKDHLGNVRVSFGRDPGSGVLSILDTNTYYPFGLNHSQTGLAVYGDTSSPLNFKYQGQELQETGFYSFKWRNYMPDVGRFFNIDPLSEKYSYQSHYNFSENRVIDAREIEGLEAKLINENTVEWKVKVIGTILKPEQISDHLKETSKILSVNNFTINVVQDKNALFTINLSTDVKAEITETGELKIVAGQVSNIGNPIDQSITSNGDPQTTAHELGHAAGLEHPFHGNQVPNTKENRNNLMNSDGNPIEALQTSNGKEILPNQTEIMKSTITHSQSRLEELEKKKNEKVSTN